MLECENTDDDGWILYWTHILYFPFCCRVLFLFIGPAVFIVWHVVHYKFQFHKFKIKKHKKSDQLFFLHSLFNGCYHILSNQTALGMSFPDTLRNFFLQCVTLWPGSSGVDLGICCYITAQNCKNNNKKKNMHSNMAKYFHLQLSNSLIVSDGGLLLMNAL